MISLEGIEFFSSMYGVSILSGLTHATLLLGWSYSRRLDLSLAFSVVIRELILYSSWVFPIFSISRTLSSRYVALSVIQLLLQRQYYLMAFDFWWIKVVMLRGSYLIIPVVSDIFVTVLVFIFFPYLFFVLGE